MSESQAPDEHVVFFTTALGDPAAERYPTLQSAVSRVESLCNEDHVQDAKVYALVHVPLHMRSYLHVAVDAASLQGVLAAPAPSAPAAPATPPPSATRDNVVEPDQDVAGTFVPDLGDDVAPVVTSDSSEDPLPTSDYASVGSDPDAEGAPSDTDLHGSEDADGSPRGRNLGFFVH